MIRGANPVPNRIAAGPFLLQKLRGTEQDKAWAIIVLAKMHHPDAPQLLERAAARVFASSTNDASFSFPPEFRRDLCYAIWLNASEGTGPLVEKYGIGTTNYHFGQRELKLIAESSAASDFTNGD